MVLIRRIQMLIVFIPLFSIAQQKNCAALHNGTFYTYDKVANNHTLIIRNGDLQQEINRETNDTSLWKVDWRSECNCMLTYVSGGQIEKRLKSIPAKVIVNVQILQTTNDYYVYKSFVRLYGTESTTSDTVWLKERPELFVKRDIKEASFPAGKDAWNSYINEQLNKNMAKLQKANQEGTCTVMFVVNEDGSLSNIQATNMQGTALARIAVDIIQNSPKWLPGSIDNKPIKMMRYQPVTFFFIDPPK